MKNSLTPQQAIIALDSVNKLFDYFRQADLDPSSQKFVEGLLHILHSYAFNVLNVQQNHIYGTMPTDASESTVVGQ